ncbi:MAG: carboxypeptidase-like regulatory domain-containing protein, partial [Planctomycetota bacterium]
MRRNKAAFLWMCLAIIAVIVFISHAVAAETKERIFSGRIIDTEGEPIAGARVAFYQTTFDYTINSAESKLTGEVTTAGDGVFSFKAAVEAGNYPNGSIVAEKEGLALGWVDWNMRDDQQRDIILGEPKELSGVVVDEAGKPVPDADVSIWLIVIGEGQDQQSLGRPMAEKLLTAATDSS